MAPEPTSTMERELAILKKKLERSEHSRVLIEQAKDHYDLVYRSSIKRLAEQKDLLDAQNRELDIIRQEQIKKNQELLEARKSADRANEAKSRFLATMSHEIRTPINGILGFLELLELTPLDEEQKRYIREADTASQVLLFLINDILDFSKIEADQMSLESIPFSLYEVIENAGSINRPRALKKNIALNIVASPGLPQGIIGDPTRLIQILNNLLGNGIKFTDQGYVELMVTAQQTDAEHCIVSFLVKDTGIGIQKDQLGSLFSAFTQADSSITRKYGGTGLGLIISQQLVELMGGEISVTSQVGVGSSFCFQLPFRTTSMVAAPPIHSVWQPTGNGGSSSVIPVNILLAEDNETNVHLIQLMLKRMGLDCDTVSNGFQAVEACKLKAYDLILMDCQMPEMDGYQASQAIRAMQEGTAKPIIIAMTANAMPGDRERCIAAGMNDYLSKPISGADFYSMINQYTERSGSPDNNITLHSLYAETLEDPRALASDIARDLMVDEDVIQSMMNTLISTLAPSLESIAASIQQKDSHSALTLLHSMAGSSGNMRLMSVYRWANRIAESIRKEAWTEAKEATDKLMMISLRLQKIYAR